VDDLRKPNPQHIQKLFEHFAYILLNITRDVVGPSMRAAADDIAGTDADRLFAPDVRDLMGLFVMLRRLLLECSITDFAFADVFRPTYQRLQKILSYVINFVRFRESQTGVIDKHFDEAERTKARVQQLYADKEALAQRLLQLQRERLITDKENKDKEARLAELKPKLLDLDRKKVRLMQDNARSEDEKKRLVQLIEEHVSQLDSTRDEAARLRPYTLQRLEVREAGLRDLNATLANERSQIESQERRSRALQTSGDAFGTATGDVQTCTRLLTDLATDMAKEDEELNKANRHREALSDRSNIVQDVERQEKLLQKQLDTIHARTEKLRKTSEEKSAAAGVKMNDLQALHQTLQKERNERARDIEKRKVRTEQTEKKVSHPSSIIHVESHWLTFQCRWSISKRISRTRSRPPGRST
jgi:kinetochore protein Nuf2